MALDRLLVSLIFVLAVPAAVVDGSWNRTCAVTESHVFLQCSVTIKRGSCGDARSVQNGPPRPFDVKPLNLTGDFEILWKDDSIQKFSVELSLFRRSPQYCIYIEPMMDADVENGSQVTYRVSIPDGHPGLGNATDGTWKIAILPESTSAPPFVGYFSNADLTDVRSYNRPTKALALVYCDYVTVRIRGENAIDESSRPLDYRVSLWYYDINNNTIDADVENDFQASVGVTNIKYDSKYPHLIVGIRPEPGCRIADHERSPCWRGEPGDSIYKCMCYETWLYGLHPLKDCINPSGSGSGKTEASDVSWPTEPPQEYSSSQSESNPESKDYNSSKTRHLVGGGDDQYQYKILVGSSITSFVIITIAGMGFCIRRYLKWRSSPEQRSLTNNRSQQNSPNNNQCGQNNPDHGSTESLNSDDSRIFLIRDFRSWPYLFCGRKLTKEQKEQIAHKNAVWAHGGLSESVEPAQV